VEVGEISRKKFRIFYFSFLPGGSDFSEKKFFLIFIILFLDKLSNSEYDK
jgi:hypothetical protein